MEDLIISMQCTGIDNKIGTFLKGKETRKQYTKTFKNCIDLFNSIRYKELKKTHKIVNI
jgi:hypothetical protein